MQGSDQVAASAAAQLSGTLPGVVGQPHHTPEDPWAVARREMERSRRYGHPLALVRVVAAPAARGAEQDPPAPPAPPAPRAGRRLRAERAARAGRDAGAQLVAGLRGTLRDIDSVWSDRRGVFMLLPESDVEAGRGLAQRLRAGDQPVLNPEDDVRIGAFPSDGLTLDALIAAVTRPVPAPALPVGPRAGDETADVPVPHARRRLALGMGHTESVADQAG
jgi:hypothetical protein